MKNLRNTFTVQVLLGDTGLRQAPARATGDGGRRQAEAVPGGAGPSGLGAGCRRAGGSECQSEQEAGLGS
jgi:hypothetical protein